jgi:hypothetical protein
VNRRLVVSALVTAVLTGGIAVPALASTPETLSHKICVGDTDPSRQFCIVWDDPRGVVGH